MINKYRILWIEDGARYDLSQLAAPLYMDGKYDLVVADDVTTGVSHLCTNGEFDAIIIDIRLPPGHNKQWGTLFKKLAQQNKSPQLGLWLLYSIFEEERKEGRIKGLNLEHIPTWLRQNRQDRIGILTVETWPEMATHFQRLGIQNRLYRQKQANLSPKALIELAQQIINKT